MKSHLILPVLCLLVMAASSSCSKEYSASGFTTTKTILEEDSFNLTINFMPVVDSGRLSFDSVYRNQWNEKYKISAFKFYVSNFDLINSDSGRTYHLDTGKCFLVNAADSATWSVKLLAKPFTYNRISFLIGIDSAHNVNAKQVGALDPANGMFWTATDGYIMAKLEGNATESGTKFDYQIGGFSGVNNVLRKPTMLFPYGEFLTISSTAGSKSILNINANANAWFYNPRQVKIETTPTCTSPGPLAHSISENYSNMFSVDTIMSR